VIASGELDAGETALEERGVVLLLRIVLKLAPSVDGVDVLRGESKQSATKERGKGRK
jgi:hypothetical protein